MPTPLNSHSGRFRQDARTLVIAGLLIVGASAAGNRYFHTSPIAASAATPEQAVAVTVAVAEPRQATLWDEFSGRLEAVDRVEVRPRVAGAILATNFTEGALVKAGDVLFKIDPAPYA